MRPYRLFLLVEILGFEIGPCHYNCCLLWGKAPHDDEIKLTMRASFFSVFLIFNVEIVVYGTFAR